MPQISPIPAITYAVSGTSRGDISTLIAPPYDVLDEEPKRALIERDGRNIVKIDLPFTPPKTVGPDAVYEEAGRTYRQWIADGVLKPSDKPAVFVYRQSYAHGGKKFARRGLIANVKIQPFGPPPEGKGGGVFAHENTIAGGLSDRLKLMRACRAQLSPIFGIYSDPGNAVAALLEAHSGGEPSFTARTDNDNVLHEVWRIDDPGKIKELTGAVAGHDLFIADGHHRYNTALNYQKENPAADHCLFVLVAMQDPGMIVLPTHRVVTGLSGFSLEALRTAATSFDLTPLPGAGGFDALGAAVASAKGHHAMGLYDPATKGCFVLTARGADPLAALLPGRHPSWRTLDVAVLHELFIERVLRPRFGGEAIGYKYTADAGELRRLSDAEPGRLGVLVRATPLESVRAVSEAGELMPAKSTYFFPKLATGLVINPLA